MTDSSSLPYAQRLDKTGASGLRSISQSGVGTVSQNQSNGAGFQLQPNAASGGLKRSTGGGNSGSIGVDFGDGADGTLIGDGTRASQISGFQNQSMVSPTLGPTNSYLNFGSLNLGHQTGATRPEPFTSANQSQQVSFINQEPMGDIRDELDEISEIGDNTLPEPVTNLKPVEAQRKGNQNKNNIQNMSKMNKSMQNQMTRENHSVDRLGYAQPGGLAASPMLNSHTNKDAAKLGNKKSHPRLQEPDSNQNQNDQDSNSQRHDRHRSSDAQSLRSMASIRSSTNISVINYNNPTINMNFNEPPANVEAAKEQNQRVAQQHHRDPGPPQSSQQDGLLQNLGMGNHPQQYPHIQNELGGDFQNSLNFSKFLPGTNPLMNSSQTKIFQNHAMNAAYDAAVGQHRNSNSAMPGAEQRIQGPGTAASSLPNDKSPHQSAASMGYNQHQYHHGQAMSQVFSGGQTGSTAQMQIQKVGTVNYDSANKRAGSKSPSQQLNHNFNATAQNFPNVGFAPMNTQLQVTGPNALGQLPTDHQSQQFYPHSLQQTQSLGESTGQFKSPLNGSRLLNLTLDEQLDINQLKGALMQLNQQVILQQQLLQQNQQINQMHANLSQSQMLQFLKQYQDVQIDQQSSKRAHGPQDGTGRPGEDPYGVKYPSAAQTQALPDGRTPARRRGQRSRSNSRKVIKKIVKKKSQGGASPEAADPTEGLYEVTTIKIGRDGTKTFERTEKMSHQPNECKDLKNSMKMLEQIKRNSSAGSLEHTGQKGHFAQQVHSRMASLSQSFESKQTETTNLSRVSGAGLLSSIMNPRNVASLRTMQVGSNTSNLYVQTMDPSKPEQKGRRRKVIVIERKRRADGSVDCARKEIYKDYGEDWARRESERLHSALDVYQGSSKVLEKLRRNPTGVQLNPDGSINLMNVAKRDTAEQRLKKAKEDMFNQRQILSESLGANLGSNARSQKNAQIMKNATRRPATALDRKGGDRQSVSSVLKREEQQKGTKISKGVDKAGRASEYGDPQIKHRAQLNRDRQKPSAGKMGKKSENGDQIPSQHDTKVMTDSFDLQPKANPSNMMSTLVGSDKGAVQPRQHKRKGMQHAQQKGLNLAYKSMKDLKGGAANDAGGEDTDEQRNDDVQRVKGIFARDSDQDSLHAPNFVKDGEGGNKRRNAKQGSPENTRGSKSTGKGRQQRQQSSGAGQAQEANEEERGRNPLEQTLKSQGSRTDGRAALKETMSPSSLTTNLYTFKLPPFDASVYIQFIDQLIFGHKRKDAIMQPIPPSVGQLKFSITRNKSGMNKLAPSYYLNLEKNNGGKILILYGKKMPFKKQSYYLISLEKNKNRKGDKDAEACLGKLRAVDGDQDKFMLYDAGENFSQKGVQFKDLRKEHGTFIYRYEPCNVGNIRKMTILYPAITCLRLGGKAAASEDAMTNDPQFQNPNPYARGGRNRPGVRALQTGSSAEYDPNDRQDGMQSTQNQDYSVAATSQHQKALGVKGVRDNHGREIPDSTKYFYSYVDWRPTSEQDTLLFNYENGEKGKNTKYKTFVDNPPQWNPKTNTYVYDFKGRVTEPSIKNFQLIPEIDGRRGDTLQDFVLQFGKRDKDEFILDIQFPISIFQGFGLALSAFDTD